MRTDVKIDLEGLVRIPAIPLHSIRRHTHATRGDIIRWSSCGQDMIGRMIGVVTASDLGKPYLCVLALFGDFVHERFVDPDDVYDIASPERGVAEWLFSEAFLKAPVDMVRDAFNHTVEELRDVAQLQAD